MRRSIAQFTKHHSAAKMQIFYRIYFSTNGTHCQFCEVSLHADNAITHLLSESHLEKAYQQKMYYTGYDVTMMNCFMEAIPTMNNFINGPKVSAKVSAKQPSKPNAYGKTYEVSAAVPLNVKEATPEKDASPPKPTPKPPVANVRTQLLQRTQRKPEQAAPVKDAPTEKISQDPVRAVSASPKMPFCFGSKEQPGPEDEITAKHLEDLRREISFGWFPFVVEALNGQYGQYNFSYPQPFSMTDCPFCPLDTPLDLHAYHFISRQHVNEIRRRELFFSIRSDWTPLENAVKSMKTKLRNIEHSETWRRPLFFGQIVKQLAKPQSAEEYSNLMKKVEELNLKFAEIGQEWMNKYIETTSSYQTYPTLNCVMCKVACDGRYAVIEHSLKRSHLNKLRQRQRTIEAIEVAGMEKTLNEAAELKAEAERKAAAPPPPPPPTPLPPAAERVPDEPTQKAAPLPTVKHSMLTMTKTVSTRSQLMTTCQHTNKGRILTADGLARLYANVGSMLPKLDKMCEKADQQIQYCRQICNMCGCSCKCVCEFLTHIFSSDHLKQLQTQEVCALCVNVWLQSIDDVITTSGKFVPNWDLTNCWMGVTLASQVPPTKPPTANAARKTQEAGNCVIMGPLCPDCMHTNYVKGIFSAEVLFFLHSTDLSICQLCELTLKNGSQTPFHVKHADVQTFNRLPCVNQLCAMKNITHTDSANAEKNRQAGESTLISEPMNPTDEIDSSNKYSSTVIQDDDVFIRLSRIRINLTCLNTKEDNEALAAVITKKGLLVTLCAVCTAVKPDECYHMTSEEHIEATKQVSLPHLVAIDKVLTTSLKHPILPPPIKIIGGFLIGTKDKLKIIRPERLAVLVNLLRKHMARLNELYTPTAMTLFYRIFFVGNMQRCKFCNVRLTAENAIAHMLSEEHFVLSRKPPGIFFSGYDINSLRLFIEAVPKIAEYFNFEEKIISGPNNQKSEVSISSCNLVLNCSPLKSTRHIQLAADSPIATKYLIRDANDSHCNQIKPPQILQEAALRQGFANMKQYLPPLDQMCQYAADIRVHCRTVQTVTVQHTDLQFWYGKLYPIELETKLNLLFN